MLKWSVEIYFIRRPVRSHFVVFRRGLGTCVATHPLSVSMAGVHRAAIRVIKLEMNKLNQTKNELLRIGISMDRLSFAG